jgi:hypothetical protein
MSVEVLERPPETQILPKNIEQLETVDFRQAFHIAEQSVVATMDSSEFNQLCDKWRIDPTDPRKAEFWRVVARCGADEAREARETGNTSLQVDLNEIASATPNYAFNQAGLNSNSFHSREARGAAKQQASQYNALLRSLTEKYPDANAREVFSGFANIARICVTDKRIQTQGVDGIWTSMRGARQEVDFEKMLGILGEDFERASLEEDRKGVDYKLPKGHLRVDLKSSRNDFHNHDRDADFSIENERDGQTIKVLSPISKKELGDTLVAPDEVLREKAKILGAMLLRIRKAA